MLIKVNFRNVNIIFCYKYRERKMKEKILEVGEEGHLSDLKIGQKARVLAIHIDKPELRRHLLDMGITRRN